MIDAEDLYDSSAEKGTLKGSILATLQKKLVVNSASLLFDVLGKVGSREAITAAGAYLNAGLYQMLRSLYRRAGEHEGYFSTSHSDFDAGLVSADMHLSQVRYTRALDEHAASGGQFPRLDAESLSAAYPGLSQSAAQVLHSVDERCRALTETE